MPIRIHGDNYSGMPDRIDIAVRPRRYVSWLGFFIRSKHSPPRNFHSRISPLSSQRRPSVSIASDYHTYGSATLQTGKPALWIVAEWHAGFAADFRHIALVPRVKHKYPDVFEACFRRDGRHVEYPTYRRLPARAPSPVRTPDS